MSKPVEPKCTRELSEKDGKKIARFSGNFRMARQIAEGKTDGWFSVTSEEPCMDWCYLNGQWQRAYVVLSHTPGAIEMTRMDKGLNLRDGHGGDQCAKLEGVTIRGNKLGGTSINWSVSERAQVLRADYESGVRDDVSVEADYSPDNLVITGERNGVPVVRCTSWVPLAAALAIVTPADPKVGTNRSADGQSATPPAETSIKPVTAPAVVPSVVTRSKPMDAKTPEQIAREKQGADTAEVFAICAHFGVPNDKAMQFARELTPLDEVRAIVLRDFAGKKATTEAEKPVVARQQEIMTNAPKGKEYSVRRAILAALEKRDGTPSGVDCGFERECSQEAAKVTGKNPGGMYIPWDAPMNRAFSITGGTGSNAISQTLRQDMFIDYLYAKLILNKLGVMILPGLVGDILLPKQTAANSGGWVDETTGGTAGVPTLGQVKGTPHTVSAYTEITRQLLQQATPAADTIVMNTLMNSIARTIQLGAFHGTGANNQPLGLFPALAAGYQGQAAITEATVGTSGSPTYAEIEAAMAIPEEANVDGPFKFAMRPTAFRKLKTTARGTTIFLPVANEDAGNKFVADAPAETTSALTAGYAAYGQFDTMALAMWGATDIIVNPYALDTAGGLRITALQTVDVLHRYLSAFAWSSKFGS
jgi:HK97 family phage major capsid protein